MPEDAAALSAVVRGHVQGVGFRDYVFTRARSLGLTGYVRNLADGRSLEVVVEGPRDQLERLLTYLRDGPRMALVERVEEEWGEASGRHAGFGVRF